MPSFCHRTLAFAAILLGLSAYGAAAQDATKRFAKLKRQYADARGDHSLQGARGLVTIVRRVPEISFADHKKLRAKAEKFLQRIVTGKGSDQMFRVRVAALESLASLAQSKSSASFFLKTLQNNDRSLRTIDYWATRALRNAQDPGFVKAIAAKGLGHKRAAVRRAVLSGLAKVKTDELRTVVRSEEKLILKALKDRDELNRYYAVRLIAAVKLESALPQVIEAAFSKKALVRMAAAYSLGEFSDKPQAWKTLSVMLKDPQARVREEAVISCARGAGSKAIPVLIARLDQEPLRIQSAIFEALETISGMKGRVARKKSLWESWWLANREELLNGNSDADTAKKVKPAGETKYAVNYYGIPLQSDKVVFVVDISGSMEFGAEAGGEKRIDVARKKLLEVVQKLDKKTQFNVLAFSGSNLYYKSKGLMPCTPENKRKVSKWIRGLKTGGGTNTYAALEAIFEEYSKADTLYLLSDGSPSSGKVYQQEHLIAQVHKWNLRRRLRIHTIALLSGDIPKTGPLADEKNEAARFMKQLADITGGSFVLED
ncbi:MAG: HEAT repeat domain-containing protein [Planctomycetota bacterium]